MKALFKTFSNTGILVIGDLMVEGGEFVDRKYATLKDRDEEADSQFKESGENTDNQSDKRDR